MINYSHHVAVQIDAPPPSVIVVLVLDCVEDGYRTAQVVAGSFIGTFIRSQIWGVVRGAGDLEEDPVHDVLGALWWVNERKRGVGGEWGESMQP